MEDETLLANDLFYCEHLNATHQKDITDNFAIYRDSGKGLDDYIKKLALYEELQNENRTYIVKDNDTEEIAGYFSLKAGLFSINEEVVLEVDNKSASFNTFPGIELAEFAVNDKYIDKYPERKGSGLIIFNDFCISLSKTIQSFIGVKVLYIFALPEENLIERYTKKYGFNRLNLKDENKLHNRIRPSFDDGCVFMYQVI